MSIFSMDEARIHYLDTLLATYGTLYLPIRSRDHPFPLQTLFQPLTLRHGPFLFERADRETDHAHHATPFQDGKEATPVMMAQNGDEALARSPLHRMIVLGGPGMGKTTLLKALLQQAIAVAHRDRAAPLPLFISLPDLARSGKTVQDSLPGILAGLGIDTSYCTILLRAINEGHAFLCLDSLDEVVPAQRPDIIALINREAIRCGGTWIIGSRFTEYKGGQFAQGQFTEWELQALDPAMRLELARHLLPALTDLFHPLPAFSAEDIVATLSQDTRIAAWGENPLLFSLAALAYVHTGMLPACRASLYHDIVTLMLNARVPDQGEREALRTVVADVALHLYQTSGRTFTTTELRALFTLLYPDASFQIHTEMGTRLLASGVLEVVASQTYGFQHQMVQEYLAAVALARQLASQDEAVRSAAWAFLWRKHTYSRWSEVLRLCVGVLVQEHGEEGNQIAAQWLRRLADERTTPDGDIGYLCLELAIGSLREFSSIDYPAELVDVTRMLILNWATVLMNERVNKATRERLKRLAQDIKMLDLHLVVPALRWFEEMRDHGDQLYSLVTANDAANVLATIFQELDVTVPAKVLTHAFPDSRGISLAVCEHPATVQAYASREPLLALLQDQQEHWRVREGAARLLGTWGEQTPITVLCEVLEETTCYYLIRIAAADVLGNQQERLPVERLVALLKDNDERIRAAIITALANLGARLPLEPFLAAVDDSVAVQRVLRSALETLGEQVAPEPLLIAIHSENAAIRAVALQLLGSRTSNELLLTLFHDTAASVRRAAVHVAGKLGEQAPFHLLREALQDQERDVRMDAVIALDALGERTPVDALLEALHDQDMSIRSEAYQALKRPGRAISIEVLLTLASTPGMRGYALALAQHLHTPLPVEILLAALDNEVYGSPSHLAASLLAEMGQDAPIAILLEMVRTPFSRARLGAANALTLLAPSVPPEPLFALLQDLDASSALYSQLVHFLVLHDAPVPLEPLINALKTEWHGGYGKKDVVVSALGALGERAPIEELLALLPDGSLFYDWYPEGRAVQVLKSAYQWITPERLLATASRRLEDEDLALAVLGALGKNAPVALLRSVLDDERRDRRLRVTARHTLHTIGVHLPLRYFLSEQDLGFEMTDYDTIASMRALGPQAPIPELLDLLVSNYKWMENPSLLQRTGNNDDWVHDTVMEALCELAPYLPFDMLVETLEHRNPLARKGAAYVLRAFGERAPVEKLITLLHDPAEKRVVRAVVLQTLAHLHAFVPVEAVVTVLSDHDGEIRRLALWSLQKWGREIPLEPLLEMMNDEMSDLRERAIMALGWLEDRAPVDLLLSLLESEDSNRVENAALALSSLGPYAPVDALIAHIPDRDGDMRPEILEALASMDEYAPLEILLQALESEDGEVRQSVSYQLNDLAEAIPAKFVAVAKDDHRAPVREALMHAIARLGKDAPVELVLDALEDEDEDVRFSARKALVELDVDAAMIPIEPLLHALRTKYSEYAAHWPELHLLAKYGAQAPAEPLLALLGDSNRRISENAAEALSQTHPELFAEVARQAEAILRGEPTGEVFASRVQSRIADRVKVIGRATPAVLAMVSDMLDWPYWEVRMKATQALGAVHRGIPDRAIRRLMELRHDLSSPAVREAADEALAEILSREHALEDE